MIIIIKYYNLILRILLKKYIAYLYLKKYDIDLLISY